MVIAASGAFAQSKLPPADLAYTQLPDPAQEARAKALMDTLRCLVCQGQSIADSDAEMAGDMRALVRQRIRAGESPAQVRKWLIERYGDYVTYDPPLSWITAPLWIAPVLLLIIGVIVARRAFARRGK
ncbi:cytochrome c-type biogenesis protein [Sphingomonas sp. DT-207]|uniref:cytochrome c-type biogenesis protein n=1 Tax=Sphingomonas sp. DT-207 TaxID=3396167 RepID=UPI003F53F85C